MKKILFVDDEKIWVEAIMTLLEKSFNFNVTFLKDYSKIDIELQKKYDAIVLDAMMPIIDSYFSEEEEKEINNGRKTGIVLCDKIRTHYPRLPIVFYSAIKEHIDCDEYTIIIDKPETAKNIANSINKLIERVSKKN